MTSKGPKHRQKQQQQQDRVLRASFLIPAYQKTLPQALFSDLPDDHRLRKIESTCGCKISWGKLPDRLAEKYRLLQLAFDQRERRGNYLGALNLLRLYFLGQMAMMPFQQTLIRPDGKQVTRKFPTSVDDCRLLMPRRFDRFGRDANGIVANLAKAAAAATAARDSECRQLAEQVIDSCLRCLAMQAAFVESEAAANDEATARRAEAAGVSAAHLVSAVDTLAHCEISRACVCALVEAGEATRLLARLHTSLQPAAPPPLHQSSVSPSRRRIDFNLSTQTSKSSSTDAKKRPSTRKAEASATTRFRPGNKQQLQKQQQQQQLQRQKQRTVTATTTAQQANNHHKPYADRVKRAQCQSPPHQPVQASSPYQNLQHRAQLQKQQAAQHLEESCDTTLADVEAITFAESEYVNAATAGAKKSPNSAVASTKLPTASKASLPETLLLCGLQPRAALALAALDRSDRRLKAMEQRTGCRLELRERRCSTMPATETDTPVGDVTHQVSYALKVVPLRSDSKPRGCANMLRSLLRRVDPSGRYFFCVVGASEMPIVAASSANSRRHQQSRTVSRQRYQQSTATAVRSKSAFRTELEQTGRQATQQQHQQFQRRRCQSQPPVQCQSSAVMPAAVAACAQSLTDRCATDCLLGIVTSYMAVVFDEETAMTKEFQRSLERSRDAVLSDALLCIFQSLTETEADSRLIDEAMDEANDADSFDDCGEENEDDLCASTTGSFAYVRLAIQRTLLVCVQDRRLECVMGAVATSLPTHGKSWQQQQQQDPSMQSSYSTSTQRARRRLARLTQTCWERLCVEAMTTSSGGASSLLGAVVFESVWEVVESEFDGERQRRFRHTQQFSRPYPSGLSALQSSSTKHSRQFDQHQQDQDLQYQTTQPLRRRLMSISPGTTATTRRPRRSSLNIRELQQQQRQRNLDKTLRSMTGRLIAEQVWRACMKAQLMQRLRLRSSA
ncbi:hypothetical protein BOX15_Mlig015063g1 [Macrostomum lignano]|uniref:Uncharacterized protein n=1 Tax=Macrostomum lignano TaxID=282301 RepID=A0A267FID6_9PLAT|nr:hypothetical protein BOX15_Mlig015063g1 [Macrostomum lignano]